jgi:hypothetical protein
MAGSTRKQNAVIAFLFAMPLLAQTAIQVGVGERTLFRWLRTDATSQAACREARRAAVRRPLRAFSRRRVMEGAFETAEDGHSPSERLQASIERARECRRQGLPRGARS